MISQLWTKFLQLFLKFVWTDIYGVLNCCLAHIIKQLMMITLHFQTLIYCVYHKPGNGVLFNIGNIPRCNLTIIIFKTFCVVILLIILWFILQWLTHNYSFLHINFSFIYYKIISVWWLVKTKLRNTKKTCQLNHYRMTDIIYCNWVSHK